MQLEIILALWFALGMVAGLFNLYCWKIVVHLIGNYMRQNAPAPTPYEIVIVLTKLPAVFIPGMLARNEGEAFAKAYSLGIVLVYSVLVWGAIARSKNSE